MKKYTLGAAFLLASLTPLLVSAQAGIQYNVQPTSVGVPAQSAPTVGYATYIEYMNGSVSNTTSQISRGDALEKCQTKSNANPTMAIKCTWNNEVIYSRVAPSTSTPAQSVNAQTKTVSGLTTKQVDSVLSLLRSFNANANAAANVKTVLTTKVRLVPIAAGTPAVGGGSSQGTPGFTQAPTGTGGAPTVGYGTYMAYLDGSVIMTDPQISRGDAFENCQTKSSANPTKAVKCTWNGEVIYSRTASSSPAPTTQSGSLSVSRATNDPVSGNIVAGSDKVVAGQFSFTAQDLPYMIQDLSVLVPSKAATSVKSITLLYKDSSGATRTATQVPALNSSGPYATATFTGLAMYVPGTLPALLTVYISTPTIASGATVGAAINVSLGTASFRAIDNDGTYVTKINGISPDVLVSSGATLTVIPPIPTPITCTKGDVDADGKITATDQQQILKHIVGTVTLTDAEKSRADVNGNGLVALDDSIDIGKYLARTLSRFSGCATGTVMLPTLVSLGDGVSQMAGVASAVSDPSEPTPVNEVAQPEAGFSYSWGRNLQIGSPSSADVTALQTALAKEGVYSGEITGGFYNQTFAAAKDFQQKYGIEATGFVGPGTRAKLNALYSK